MPIDAHAVGTVEFGPWNPGVSSELPAPLRSLSTIFRPENVFTSAQRALELRDLIGFAVEDLVVFRPERLLVHELLIRVTADLSVPDGSKVEDLGINFRRMVETILSRHIAPHAHEIAAKYESIRRSLTDRITAELAVAMGDRSAPAAVTKIESQRRGWLHWLRSTSRSSDEAHLREEDSWEREERILREWTGKAHTESDPLEKSAYRALLKVVAALRGMHGRIWGDMSLLVPVIVGVACNDAGSEAIGSLIDPWVRDAAKAEGYLLLPAQAHPVVMNTKGASASGKSTMRPLQKKLAGEIGVRWSDFALISPDIWRKYLLDYDSLGEAFRYAGTFAGQELAIVDHKLDRYMAKKAERGGMSHLLIDRFRFDSFAPDSDEAGSNLLTRFGEHIYMFFMITPPHVTVERSWKRGLDVGRYKAVDDLLAHNIEAYTGMPQLFFTWALRPNKQVHYEFLDNSVPFGDLPRTVAFGWNGEMNILSVKSMLDVDRYRKIDVAATRPEDVYSGPQATAPEHCTQFLLQCGRTLAALNLVDRDSGRIYLRLEAGRLAGIDPVYLAKAVEDPETRAGVSALAPEALVAERRPGAGVRILAEVVPTERFPTLGQMGRHGA